MQSKKRELLMLLEEKARRKRQNDYSTYCEYVHRNKWTPARHTDLICHKLEQVEQGKIKRLMIFMPPRHSKSMTVTETFPSYFIGKDSDRRVIAVSYGDELARRFGKLNRQKIEEFGQELFGISIAKDQSSMTNFDIDGHRGGMISVGIGGSITGQGADLLLVDDPIKNREQADSQVYREKIWQEWQNTLLTRLHPDAAIILILTRWHEDDLAGRLLNPEYGEVEDWDIVSLPAIAEENDLLDRKPGEPLWPEHGFDQEWAEAKKIAVGSRTWAALYQQRPAPEGGQMLKRHWWKFYSSIPTDLEWQLQSWDCSFKDSDGTDFVVGQVWGVKGSDVYLLDQMRDRMDLPVTIQALLNLTDKWPNAMMKLIEDKANGPAVISMLRHKTGGLIAVEPRGSKEARASAVSPLIEAGNVYLPSPAIAPWIDDFIEECAAFPNGAHDDQVDAMSQALGRFMYTGVTPEPKEEDTREYPEEDFEDYGEGDGYFD